MRLGLIILAIVWSQLAWSFPENIAPLDISSASLYYIDPSGSKSLKEIQSLGPNAWRSIDVELGNFGFRSEVFWFKVALPPCSQANERRVLEIAYPLLDIIEFWVFSGKSQQSYVKTGDTQNANQRPYEHVNFGFPLPCTADLTAYMRISTEGIMQVPLRVWTELAFVANSYKKELPQIVYLSAMLMMAFYNAFMMFSARRLSYLFYIFHTLSIVAFQAGVSGIGFRYVWPNLPLINEYVIDKSVNLMVLFALAFGVNYTEVKSHSPGTYNFIVRICAILALYSIASFALPYHLALRVSIGWVIFGIGIGLYLIGTSIHTGRYTRFWSATWIIFLVGSIALIVTKIGIVPRNALMEHSMQLGTVLVSALISYAMADQLNVLRLNLAESNGKLAKTLESIETIVREKTENIRTIMNTLQQGILTLRTPDLLIEPEYSRATENILGREKLEGSNFEKVFLERLNLGSDVRVRAISALQISLNEDPISFELNASQLPLEAQIVTNQGLRDLVIDWVPILKDETIDRYLVAFRDVTELKILRSSQQKQSEMLGKLREIVESDVHILRKFLHQSEHIIHHNLHFGLASTIDDEHVKNLLLHVHTLKGESRSLGLTELADYCHQLEDIYMAMRLRNEPWNPQLIAQSVERVKLSLGSYRQIYQENIEHLISEDDVLVDQSMLNRWKDKLNVLMVQEVREREALRPILNEIYNILYLSFDSYKGKLQQKIRRISEDLGQLEPELHVVGDALFLAPKIVELFDRCFIHIVQNALVHGIENQALRRERGKSPIGTITIAVMQDPFFVRLLIEDDGAGIEVAKISQKASSMGYILPGQILDNETIKTFMFRSGFSSTDVVSPYAGRGVGLDAIRHYLGEYEGQFNILFGQERLGFLPMQLVIDLPAHLFPEVPWKKTGEVAA